MQINFLGDSITIGAGAKKVENMYTYLVCKHFSAQENNFGVSGTRIARQKIKTNNPDDDVFVERAKLMPKDADFTFVFGGTNDYGHGDAPLGVGNSANEYTFYGAFYQLVSYLTNNFAKSKLCFVLPLPRYNQDNLWGDGTKQQPIAPLFDYIEIEKDILRQFDLDFLDLSEFFPVPQSCNEDELTIDGLHPNPKGHKIIADKLIEYLESKIKFWSADMMQNVNEHQQEFFVAKLFSVQGDVLSVEPYGEGHINKTYLVVTTQKRYILQQMNTNIFPNSDGLMANICAVTNYLKSLGVETLDVIPTVDGKPYYKGEKCYRMYAFIENTVSYQTVTDNKVFENAGKAFGEFQNHLAGFDASVLCEVIPNFHHTPKRYEAFAQALSDDKFDRAKLCQEEINFVISQKDNLYKVVEGLADGTIPLRVTHNDTKLNNILMDAQTNQARAIIDLDTIMPGSMLYDFGDSIRFGANTGAEDEQDLSKVHFDISKFQAYARGFVPAVKNSITPREVELLPYSAYLLTMECGMRFLTDYLQGNVYFATKYETHNLVRCRTQFKLANEMQQAFEQMSEIISGILN